MENKESITKSENKVFWKVRAEKDTIFFWAENSVCLQHGEKRENRGMKWDHRGRWGSNRKVSSGKKLSTKYDEKLLECFKQESNILIYIF